MHEDTIERTHGGAHEQRHAYAKPHRQLGLERLRMHIALKESMDPTERSMAPEEIMHIIPTASSMRYEFASSIFTAFFTEKNEFVRTERNAAHYAAEAQ